MTRRKRARARRGRNAFARECMHFAYPQPMTCAAWRGEYTVEAWASSCLPLRGPERRRATRAALRGAR